MYYVPACGSDNPHHPHPMAYPTFLGLFKQEQKPPKKHRYARENIRRPLCFVTLVEQVPITSANFRSWARVN